MESVIEQKLRHAREVTLAEVDGRPFLPNCATPSPGCFRRIYEIATIVASICCAAAISNSAPHTFSTTIFYENIRQPDRTGNPRPGHFAGRGGRPHLRGFRRRPAGQLSRTGRKIPRHAPRRGRPPPSPAGTLQDAASATTSRTSGGRTCAVSWTANPSGSCARSA